MPPETTIERPAGIVLPETRHLTAQFLEQPEIRDSDTGDGSWTFIGHAAVWNRLSVDLGGFRERIMRGAFTSVLDDAGLDTVLVADHGLGALSTVASIRGKTLELSEDAKGLRVYATIAPTSVGQDLRVLIQRGDVQGMSFGFRVAEGGDTWLVEDDETIRVIRQMGALVDVSIVSFPAYPQTDVSARAQSMLVERREMLVLYNPATGDPNEPEIRAIRSKVERRELELTSDQAAALESAEAKLTPAPAAGDQEERAMTPEITDLCATLRALAREPEADERRAEAIARAQELHVPGMLPPHWTETGELRDGAWETPEQRETFNDIYTALSGALDQLLVTDGEYYWCYVVDFTADTVIFTAGGELWSAPYTLAAGGAVTIGTKTRVRPVTEFVPAETIAADETVGERAAPARDALERRLRLQAMQIQL